VPQIAIFGIKEGDRAIIMVPGLPVLEISSNVISEGGSVQQAAYMDRREVRAEFEMRFTAARMARAYVAAYRALLARVPATVRLPEVAMPAVAAREVSPLAWERLAKQGGGQVLNPAG
jgi:hypothetical protein